jgi:hypothetical protein
MGGCSIHSWCATSDSQTTPTVVLTNKSTPLFLCLNDTMISGCSAGLFSRLGSSACKSLPSKASSRIGSALVVMVVSATSMALATCAATSGSDDCGDLLDADDLGFEPIVERSEISRVSKVAARDTRTVQCRFAGDLMGVVVDLHFGSDDRAEAPSNSDGSGPVVASFVARSADGLVYGVVTGSGTVDSTEVERLADLVESRLEGRS